MVSGKSFGYVSADKASYALELSFPGVTSYCINSSGANICSATANTFPVDDFFGMLNDAVGLDFDNLFGLLDLDIECKRQALERTRLHEEFSDPHPNFILGRSKDSWFTEMVMEKLSANHFHVSFVSTIRWIEVNI